MISLCTCSEEEEREPLTPERLFSLCGTIRHENYRRSWTSNDYRMLCGKHKGKLLSRVADHKYLTWCLNFFESQLDSHLYSAIKDQFNAQFS